jgi:hypothetical protein
MYSIHVYVKMIALNGSSMSHGRLLSYLAKYRLSGQAGLACLVRVSIDVTNCRQLEFIPLKL